MIWSFIAVQFRSSTLLKAYKLLDLESKQVFTSRYVIFYESIYPFHANPPQFDTPLPLSVTPFIPTNYPPLTAPPSSSAITDPHSSDPSPSTSPFSSSSMDVPQPSPIVTPSPSQPAALVPTKKSSRPHKQPSYLHDYHCNVVIPSASLPPAHHAFVSLLAQYPKP